MTSIIFDTFDVPSFLLANQSVLSLYALGKATGLVLDSGDGATSIVPVYEGHPVSNLAKIDLAGRDLTDYLLKLLS